MRGNADLGNTARGEPPSPFRHLMSERPLSPREILHRRLMLAAFRRRYGLTSAGRDTLDEL